MSQTASRDGTTIAFDRAGNGPPLILALGAFNDRAAGTPLANALQADFTVFNYDRRGRGASGDTLPYAVDREIEDLEALIAEAGGSAFVFGYSSGAVLALHAAARGAPIAGLALYDPPAEGANPQHAEALAALIAEGERGAAVEYFQAKVVGLPEPVVKQARQAPYRPYLEAIAHTTVYDTMLVSEPPKRDELAGIAVPTLVVVSEAMSAGFKSAAERIAAGLPQGRYRCLEGQNHHIQPPVLAPVVKEFLLERPVDA